MAKDTASAHAAAVAPYIELGKKTYPSARARYLAGLPKGETFFVVTKLIDAAGKWEQVFICVQSIDGDSITGTIASRIQVVSGFKAGQTYRFNETDLVDWLISKPDGSEEGNVVGKFLDTNRQ